MDGADEFVTCPGQVLVAPRAMRVERGGEIRQLARAGAMERRAEIERDGDLFVSPTGASSTMAVA